jgi:hypothetical protein
MPQPSQPTTQQQPLKLTQIRMWTLWTVVVLVFTFGVLSRPGIDLTIRVSRAAISAGWQEFNADLDHPSANKSGPTLEWEEWRRQHPEATELPPLPSGPVHYDTFPRWVGYVAWTAVLLALLVLSLWIGRGPRSART